MADTRLSTLRRRPWLMVLVTVTCALSLTTTFMLLYPAHRLTGDFLRPANGNTASTLEQQAKVSKDYRWDTQSPFEPPRYDDWENMSATDLCASFPTHLLREIQPVLKTGHGVIEARVRPQLRNGLACLNNLLIYSDVSEALEGHHIIDVFSDINETLLNHSEQTGPYRKLRECIADGLPECDKILEHEEAWQIDKFKFLATLSDAWKMRKERQWYVFFEADSMIVWDNVFRMLANFDPDVPLYFGSPSPGREGTWFAYGGSGYVLSRAAMRKLTTDDWHPTTGEYLGSKLTERYWDVLEHDCCGDSVVGWAAHESGANLSGLWPMFNPHPPHGVPFSSLYWCQPLLGMHKPNEEEVHDLWRWQYGHRTYERPLLYRDLAVSYFNVTSIRTKTNWNNADFDGFGPPSPSKYYKHDPHESPDACASACESHPNCFSWTHHPEKCVFVRSIRIGQPVVAGKARASLESEPSVAGWPSERIKNWVAENPCDEVQWVRPSIERIF